MKKVSLIKNFYNGDIGEGSIICNELTIEFKEEKTKMYISRYYYGTNMKHASIVGEVNLFDLYKDEYTKVLEEYQTTINQMTSTYKEEYFQEHYHQQIRNSLYFLFLADSCKSVSLKLARGSLTAVVKVNGKLFNTR